MKASELRIGNLIDIYLISSPSLSNIHVVEPTTLMMIMGLVESKGTAFRPIPLTEEWVLNFGFEKHHTLKNEWLTMYISEEDGIGVFLNIQDMIIYYCNDPIFRIKHVHDLQNFMFALTGEELVLKKQLK